MPELKRVLGFKVILLITINSIMGTGIFFLPAVGAKYSGPASIISWIILSIISIYIAMCFAELSSMFPKAGGIYEFCKRAFGRFWSFVIGWITLIAGNITIAMLVVGAIQYLLPVHAPFVKMMISLFFILSFNYVAYKGMKTSSFMLVTFAVITLATLFALIIPGLFKMDFNNLTPFFVFPAPAIFITIFFIAETFFGWETATFLAEETKQPRKVMPKALVIGTVIIAIICILFVVTSLGNINWKDFAESKAPLADLAINYFGYYARDIFTLAVYLSIIGSVAGWIVSAPRLVLALTRDKLFLPSFKEIHHKYNTPYKAIMFQTVLTSILVLVGFGSYRTLLTLLLPLVLIMYSAVLFSLFILRIKKPNFKRYFKVPFGKLGVVVVIMINFLLISLWLGVEENAWHILRLGLSFIALGIPVYLLLEMYYSPKAVRKTNNVLAYLALFTERLALPLSVRREIIRLLGNIKGKTILEFGCSVGTLTLHLAEEVGNKGKVFATDISERDLSIAQKRMDKKGHTHVRLLHDLKHHERLHQKIPDIHVVVSVGMLGYMQNVDKILRGMNKRLKKGSPVCFVDYDKFFDIIPNIDWLRDDEKIKDIFMRNGFKVRVKREQGFAWKYIYVYGKKVRDVK
jgi:amino acid transporter